MATCYLHGTTFRLRCPDCEKAELLRRQSVAVESQNSSGSSGSNADLPSWFKIISYVVVGGVLWWYLIILPISEGELFVGLLFFLFLGWGPLLGLLVELWILFG